MSVDGITVTTSADQGHTTIYILGDLDALTAPRLRDAAEAAGDVGDVVLDLEGVDFIDSSGLACILETNMVLVRRERRLHLGPRSALVQRLLDVSGVGSLFDL